MTTQNQRNRAPTTVKLDNVESSHRRGVQHVVQSGVNGVLQSEVYDVLSTSPDSDDPLRLSLLVKERRLERGLSQQELARRIGISKAAISSIEIGRTKSLRGPTLAGLMRELGISPEDLVGKRAMLSKHRVYAPPLTHGPNGPTTRQGVVTVGEALVNASGIWSAADQKKLSGELDFPSEDPDVYALRVMGDALQPRIRSGEFLVCEPGHEIVPGDEVVLTLNDGRTMIRELAYQRDGQTAVNEIGPSLTRVTHLDSDIGSVHFIAAIVKSSRYHES